MKKDVLRGKGVCDSIFGGVKRLRLRSCKPGWA